jgi:cytochrome bd-type quinol oxidase subunit 2
MRNLYPARRIAQGALVIGSTVAVAALAIAVSHFVFGVEVTDRNNGQLTTAWGLALGLLFMGTVGTVFAVVGALVLRAARRHNDR